MAADRTRTTLEENDEVHSSDLGLSPDHGCSIPKRHARVTVKYNRKELQRRLDVEKWIDESLDRLYSGQERDMPEEVNIDDLIDLPNDEERVKKVLLIMKLEEVYRFVKYFVIYPSISPHDEFLHQDGHLLFGALK
uniref:Protein phosphatase 1, regulatory (inhibitor) subunit 14Aa n=1 Tax=Dicentrarchus labrax TaxID=13489 RepID=A0A8P4KS74_DICLA